MSSSHPKPTRSRLPSPHRLSSSSVGHSRGGNIDGSRTFMQRWLEPPVQNKASFQEAGLMRGGVVENMAPLGTLPKAAMLKKAPLCAESPPPSSGSTVKRIVLKKPFSPASVGTAVPLITTPSATATPSDITRMSSSEAAGAMEDATLDPMLSPTSHLALPLPVIDDMNDDDYVPKKSKSRRVSHRPSHASVSSSSATPTHPRRQSHRHRSARSSPVPPHVDPTPDPTPAPTSPTRSETPSIQQLAREPDDKEQASKIVEIAVDEALRHFRYPTAWALRLLYDENSRDPHFVSMIEDIYYQRATPKIIRKFRRLVSEKKKEGKKENKGCYYFVPPPTGGRFAPHKPAPAPYENLIKMEFATLLRTSASDVEVDADGHVSKRRKTEAGEGRKTPVDQADTQPHVAVTATTNGAGLHPHGHKNGNHAHSHHARGGVAKEKSPRGKKTRSGSVSSTSSLSSVPDDAIEDYDDFMGSVDGDLETSRMEGQLAEGNNAQIPAGSMQPISVGQAKPAVKKQIVSPNPAPEHNTPTTHHPRSRDSSMPAAAITTTNGNPHQHHTSQAIPTLKFQSRFGDASESPDSIIRKKLSRKSETAVNTKSVSADSFVREPLGLDELLHEPALPPQPPAPPPEHARLSRTPAPALSSRAARAAKRNHDDFDDASSPTASSFRADFEPLSSARNSRAATPTNPRSSKKPRGGLRVKTSPMKKKGTSAGIPRGNGERPSPVSNGVPYNQDDNDDSCYTCGGNGELVCCDGCTFSFHFMCIDPPMDEGRVPDEWFCNECQMRYNPPPEIERKGIFGPLVTNLQRKNPRAFRLPEPIREYFEGVKTGTEGEYEEAVLPKPKASKKNTEEAFDFFKLRNGDKAVLCHNCHKGATDNRPIIPCSVCGLNWHLECLSPPLALPPILRTWRCPCHVDDLLSDLPVRLAPAHKYRKIKNMPVIEQCYSRGLANNGWIEIEEDDSDDDDDETAWRENKAFGRVFRVSAKGIKREFISRVHQNRGGSSFQPGIVNNPASTVPLKMPSLEEQQAALTLVQLADGQGDGAHQLVHAMMSHASPAAVSMLAKDGAQRVTIDSLADADIATLETVLAQANALKQRVSKILESRTNHACHESSDIELKALTPNSISHDDSTIVDELKLEFDSSQDAGKAQHADDAKPVLDSAMQTD
ncbi:hypothetical protein F5B22DRAFT_166849 [Xylaria bambusicola]|uniref:uncharacterized protein n=1 Tax=Xylaria bambusicola TaxID=326684 RepID=UPI0020086D4D|nr:uncharacterized protein F5B22DRAFT_166849 [Xylaria bambusicola]KAI0526587.1 hypothetical protein F5B22DRAFT_166849 [Xylaria bambusicola]